MYFRLKLKHSTVLRLAAGERLSRVADELKIKRKLLYEWRSAYRKMGVAGLNRKRGPKPGFLARTAELERKVGRQQMDLDFFRKALRLIDALEPKTRAASSTRSSKR